MPTRRETILAALHGRLQTLATPVLRGDVLPERIPTTGLIILRGGKPGAPEVTLSPLTYYYEHWADLEVVIQAGAGHDGLFDALTGHCCTNRQTFRVPLSPDRLIPRLL